MNKIVVVEERRNRTHDGILQERTRRYEAWTPPEYLMNELKRDVSRHWELKPSKYELFDDRGNAIQGNATITSLETQSTTFTLRRARPTPVRPSSSAELKLHTDALSIRDHLFELFLQFALRNQSRNDQMSMTKQQLKQLLQHVTADDLDIKKRKFEFETVVDLTFKRCASRLDGLGALSFDGFLDALVGIAIYLFPKPRSEQSAFELLVCNYLIPFYMTEQQIAGEQLQLSWSSLDAVLAGSKTQQVNQRFAKTLSDLAETYGSALPGVNTPKRLQFHEFRQFVCGIKAKALHVTTAELCKIFLHCVRKESESLNTDDLIAKPSLADIVGSGAACGNSMLTVSCKSVMTAVSYMAWVVAGRLAKTKRLAMEASADRYSGKTCARAVKALLHHISHHLRDRVNVAAKNAAFNAARLRFLHDFDKMHREDAFEDYQHIFFETLHRDQLRAHDQARHGLNTPRTVLAFTSKDNLTQKLDNSIFQSSDPDPTPHFDSECSPRHSCGEESDPLDDDNEEQPTKPTTDEAEDVSSSIPVPSSQDQMDVHGVCNEADEMYAFLTSELLRFSDAKRSGDGVQLVEPMLDIWVAAGEKYSQVIAFLDEQGHDKADISFRWGLSLEVFATQVLKHATTVYDYENVFGITNPRIFSVSCELWGDELVSFGADLAMESLSLASTKLMRAASDYHDLLGDAYAPNSDTSDDDSDLDESEPSEQLTSAVYEKYLASIFHRAKCMTIYADARSHGKKTSVDYQLGCTLEEELDFRAKSERLPTGDNPFFNSAEALTKSSSYGEFYNEARKMYLFLVKQSQGQTGLKANVIQYRRHLGAVKFKLAALMPQGSVVETHLLQASLANWEAWEAKCTDRDCRGSLVSGYIRGVITARHSFFQSEAPRSIPQQSTVRNESSQQDEARIVPFYRFILAAAYREFDVERLGRLARPQLTEFNRLCKRDAVSERTMKWLLDNFEHQDGGLTERGFFAYFGWLAEADPLAFCEILDLLTSKYTDTHHSSMSTASTSARRPLQKSSSLRPKMFIEKLVRSARENSECGSQSPTGIAESVVILSGKLHHEALDGLKHTTSPSEVELEPELLDILPSRTKAPEELSKFCFPDAMFLSCERRPPKHFDIVLTDIKGSRLYASCLHYFEERDPMDVLALISAAGQDGKTVDLPPWISLRDIQQGRTKWRCFLPKCLCVLSSVPLFKTFRAFLVHLYRLLRSPDTINETPEAFVFNFLEQIRLPAESSMQVTLKLGEQPCLIRGITPGFPLFYPNEVDFLILAQCLSAENIVKVYGYLLTEQKVVLCAKNKAILTPVAETFRALLHPFEYQQVYIPLLSMSLFDFVTAPVPFFMGISSANCADKLEAEGVVLVDLDNNDIRVPASGILPTIPDSKTKKLLPTLRKLLSTWSFATTNHHLKEQFGSVLDKEVTSLPSSYRPSHSTDAEVTALVQAYEDTAEQWAELQGIFSAFAIRIIKDVRKFCVKTTPSMSTERDSSSFLVQSVLFDKRGFLAMYQSMREFCTQLFQTQLFQRFLDNFTSVIDMLNLPEPDQSKRGVRSITSLRRHLGEATAASDDQHKQQQQLLLVRAPLPPMQFSTNSGDSSTSKFRSLDVTRYEDLLCGKTEEQNSSLLARSRGGTAISYSSSNIDTFDSFVGEGTTDPSSLVSEARRRLEIGRSQHTSDKE